MPQEINFPPHSFIIRTYDDLMKKYNNWLLLKEEAKGELLPSMRRKKSTTPPQKQPPPSSPKEEKLPLSSSKDENLPGERFEPFKKREPQTYHLDKVEPGSVVRVVDRDTRWEYLVRIGEEGEIEVTQKRDTSGVSKGEDYLCNMHQGDILYINENRFVLEESGLVRREEKSTSFGPSIWKAYDAVAREIIRSGKYGGFIYKPIQKEVSVTEDDALKVIKEKIEDLMGGTSYWGLSAEETEEVADKAREILANYIYDKLHNRDLSKYSSFGEALAELELPKDFKKTEEAEEVEKIEEEEKEEIREEIPPPKSSPAKIRKNPILSYQLTRRYFEQEYLPRGFVA